nr:hypothetical protein [uncultured Chryseobacterium sp.]
MEYVIELLEKNRKFLERNIRQTNLMKTDTNTAILELNKVGELRKAIKILKLKNRKQ